MSASLNGSNGNSAAPSKEQSSSTTRLPKRSALLIGGILFGFWLVLCVTGVSPVASFVVIGCLGGGAALLAMQKNRTAARSSRAVAVVDTTPPVWPPRRPDNWGIEIQEKYEKDLRAFQFKQSLYVNGGLSGGGGIAPRMPIIPSWEVHHRQEQDRDPIQIRWAQTDSGDWLRMVWGNRSITPERGKALPVFQSMQRKDTGQWVWVWLGDKPEFDWQQGLLRMEDFTVTDAQGNSMSFKRPCGHPSYVAMPRLPEDVNTHGSAKPLTDDELFEMGSLHPIDVSGKPSAAIPPMASPSEPSLEPRDTFGSARPLSDDDLKRMGAYVPTPSDVAPEQAAPSPPPPVPPTPPVHHSKPEVSGPGDDPSRWGGIL